jgi:hypothetical protein
MTFRRWRSRLAGMPVRVFMAFLSRRVPRQEYDGIRLVVADRWLEPSADRFFDRTKEALAEAASGAPRAYPALREDVRQIVLSRQTGAPSYQPFLLAVVVLPPVAFEADPFCYAAWLLHTSASLHGEDEAQVRSGEYLSSLAPEQRARVAAWLQESLITWKEM